jgi:oligopeptide transport system ATP-binding protein
MLKEKVQIDYTQKVLELNNVQQHFKTGFGKRKIIVKAVDGVSFDVYKRESFGLVGESGCGKTTLGRTIIKLYQPSQGLIKLNGIPVGMGYQGNIANIKQYRSELKQALLQHDTYKLKISQIQHAFKTQKESLKKQINDLREKGYEAYLANIKEIDTIIQQLVNLKETYLTEKAEVTFRINQTILSLTNTPEFVEKKNFTYKISSEKNKAKKKIGAIKDSKALEKSVRLEQIRALEASRDAKIEELTKEFEIISSQIKESESEKQVRLEKVNALKIERNEKSKQLYQTYLVNKKALQANLKDKKQHKVSKSLPSEVKIKLDELQQLAKNNVETYKNNLKTLKNEFKSNPDQFTVNLSAQNELKSTYKALIDKEKEVIKTAHEVEKMRHDESLNKMQMIFQDPIASLNPRMTVKEIISEGLRIQGIKDDQIISEKVFEVLKIVGLVPEHAFRYPHEFSGGQRQRIGIARALIVNPDFIIADEPISALDVSIQAQIINLMNELKSTLGLTILFIAHDLSVVKYFCDRIAVMYYGKIVEMASADELFKNPLHPYTKSLLSAVPQPDPISERKRQRVSYNPAQHDYSKDKPELHEVYKEHFIYANTKELAEYKKKLQLNEVQQ